MFPESDPQKVGLDRFWDAIVLGQAGSEEGVDPMDVAMIRQLHHDGRLPELEAAFRRRLRRDLLRTPSLPVSTSPSSFAVDDEAPRAPGRLAPPWEPQDLTHGSWRRWTLAQLATAGLVLVMLVASYVVFGSPRLREAAAPVVIPALVGTPEASPALGLTEETLLQQRFDEIPSGADWTGVERYTFAPGETWTQGDQPGSGFGPMLYRVEAGTMSVHAAAPFHVTRAGTRAAVAATAETEITLAPGDVVFMPYGVTSEWRNPSTVPARIMDTGIAFTSDVSPKDVDADYNYNIYPILPPPAPLLFTLRRFTLPPGTRLPTPTGPGLAYLGVESGELMIVWRDDSTPSAAPKSQQVGPPAMTGASNMVELVLHGTYHVAQELRNDGPTPVSVLELSIKPIDGSTVALATPMS